MEKGSIESSPNKNKSTIVVYLVVSADQNGQFDRFERLRLMNSCNTDIFFSHYYHLQSVRFELRAIGDLLPGLTSFVVNHFCSQTSKSLPSLCIARYYNVLIGKRVKRVSMGGSL